MLFGHPSVCPSEPVEPDWMLELVCLQDCVGEMEGAGWEEGACTCELLPASERRSGHAPATNRGGGGGHHHLSLEAEAEKEEGEGGVRAVAAVPLRMRAYFYNVGF